MILNLSELSTGLDFINGIWYSKNNGSISYPTKGNEECFEIEDTSYWFKHRNKILCHVIQNFSNTEAFFDVGGGNGYVTKALQESGLNAYLVEPGIYGINNAAQRGVKNLINATLQNCEFKKESIYNIGLFDVLEHIDDDSGFLRTINDLLVSDGMVFISVPAYKFLWSESDLSAGHFRRYSARSLSALLRKNGYAVVYKSYFFTFLVPIIFIFRTIPWIFIGKQKRTGKDRDHMVTSRIVKKLIGLLTRFETYMILQKRRIILGSSCIIVAKKLANDTI
jgi:2-polyprenyl-3-methyl-5-hydroxy-6-metoxy-1,4-benzoquinol methylase